MNKRMSPAHYWLCRAILLLDKVALPMKVHHLWPPPEREYWMLVHVFGTNILVARKWFDLFYHEHGYRQAQREVKRSNGQMDSNEVAENGRAQVIEAMEATAKDLRNG